jgi:hypothetical protein
MNMCNWEAIHGFESPGEYKRFCSWLSDQIDAGLVEGIPVTKQSGDLIFGLDVRWYRCKASEEVWRLVAPQAPFKGAWEPIPSDLERGRL